MGASEKNATARVSTLPLLLHLLPQDILFEILSKLPAKLLVRFRCVSKLFYALIADHGFGALHRSSSLTLPSRAGILIAIKPHSSGSSRAFYTINFSEQNPQRPGMLQANRLGYLDAEPFLKCCLHSSWDGLICLSRLNGDVVVCNVSTGQRISLPTIQFPSACALLGFDSQSKRYKILMIDWRMSSFGYKHWVLTVGVDKSWREINYSSHPIVHPIAGYGCPSYSNTSVYIGGVIYSYNWLTKSDLPNFNIVAFEVGSESFSLIPFPAEVSSSSRHYSVYSSASFTKEFHVLRNVELLQVDGGRLAIVVVRRIDRQFYMDVWTWLKSKECWEKTIMTIPLEESRTIYAATYLRSCAIL